MDNSLLKELAAARRRRASESGEQSPKRPRVAGDQASNASNDNEVIDLMASDDEAPPEEDDAAMAARLQREEELDASAALAARLQGEELLRGAAEVVTHGPYAYPAARRRELVDPFFAVEFKHPSWFAGEVYDAIAASERLSLVSCHGYGPGSELDADAWYPSDHAQALRCARGKCFYTRLHGTIGESQGDYGEHHLLPLCDRLRQHSAGGGLSFVGLNNVGGEPPSAVVDAATIAARLNGP